MRRLRTERYQNWSLLLLMFVLVTATNATMAKYSRDKQRVCMHLHSQDLFRLHDLNANGVLEEEALQQMSLVLEG